MFFTKSNLYPKVIRFPSLSEYDEILWLCVRPKVLPRPFNIIAIAVFYYSSNQNIDSKRKFIQQLQTSADFNISKYPNAGLFFLVGDANDLKMDSFCSSLKVKQIVKIPMTRGNTSLDVILTNMYNFYSPPSALPPFGGSYYLSILLSPPPQILSILSQCLMALIALFKILVFFLLVCG